MASNAAYLSIYFLTNPSPGFMIFLSIIKQNRMEDLKFNMAQTTQ